MKQVSRRGRRESRPRRIPRREFLADYEFTFRVASEIVDANWRRQWQARRRLIEELAAYVERRARQGRSNPMVIEALADFTFDNRRAIPIYRRALRVARSRRMGGQTILLELARRYLEDRPAPALVLRYARASLSEARRRRDKDCAEQAERFLEEFAAKRKRHRKPSGR